MAFHYYLYKDNRSPLSYVEEHEPKLVKYALEAESILKIFHELTVWKIQQKGKGQPNICWYVGFKDREEPFLLNFTIISSDLHVEFRLSQYVPSDIYPLLKWQTTSWLKANLKTNVENNIKTYIRDYIENLSEPFKLGKLKKGGSSFAEKVIYRLVADIFPDSFIQSNIRLNHFRSEKGKPLELDIYIQDKNLAIEVQGPQHSREIYGSNADLIKNDLHKKQMCKDNGIKLIWLDWEGLNVDMLKNVSQKDDLQHLINTLLDSDNNFLWWKSSKDLAYET